MAKQSTPGQRVEHRALQAGSGTRVSVVIPLYNHEQYIETTINSVLAQTVRPAEIIVVDDGSTDGSAEKLRSLCKIHPEIIFWSEPNQGAHHALNAAIHRATGDFVAILNSDDCYDPERFAACLAVVQEDPNVEVVATRVSFIDAQGNGITNAWYENALAFYAEKGDLSLALFHANFLLTTSNLFLRRTLFESVGYFSPLRYTHDLEFFLRLILAKKHVHFLDRTLLAYRQHEKNTVTENRARLDAELAVVFAYFLYRQEQMNGTENEWRSWLEKYVDILGQNNLLDTVEYILAMLDGKRRDRVVAASLSEEFRGLLLKLGVNWDASGTGDSLMAQFISARDDYLRRWERANSEAQAAAAAMEESKAWLESQRLAWENLAAQREQELIETKAWLESQRQAWENLATAREQNIVKLIETKAWLESQRQAWENLATEREQNIVKLIEAKEWLEAQWQAWKKLAAEREQNILDLTSRLEADEAILNRIRTHHGMRLINFLSRKNLFGT